MDESKTYTVTLECAAYGKEMPQTVAATTDSLREAVRIASGLADRLAADVMDGSVDTFEVIIWFMMDTQYQRIELMLTDVD